MRALRWYCALFFLLLVVGIFVPNDGTQGLTVLFVLFFGWPFYLWRVVPQMTWNVGALLSAAACLLLWTAGLHALLGWLAKALSSGPDVEDSGIKWTPGWTACVVGVVFLAFAAGTATVGVAQHTRWFLSEPGPFFEWPSTTRFMLHRTQSLNNVRNISTAMHQYSELQGSFPDGARLDDAGRPMHGWQASLLPFLDSGDVYQSIDFAKPWNAPQNRTAMQSQVASFLNPALEARTVDGLAASHYAGNAWVLRPNSFLQLRDVPDGGVTILGGEIAERIQPWGHPLNLRSPALGLDQSASGFGGPWEKSPGANFFFVDGSARFLSSGIDPAVFRALCTPAGGEKIPDDH
jgi:hypothetical protein